MASIRKRDNKDGSVSYLITCSRRCGDGSRKSVSTTWKPDEGMDEEAVQISLQDFAARFEQDFQNNTVKARRERTRAVAQEGETRKEWTAANRDNGLTLCQFYKDTFRPMKEMECSLNTLLSYDQLVSTLSHEPLWAMKLTEIKPYHIQNFLQHLRESGKKVSSVNLRRNQVNAILREAVNLGLLETFPFHKVRPLKESKDMLRQRQGQEVECSLQAMTLQETLEFLAAVNQQPLLWKTLFRLGLDSGMRLGELRGLRWNAVDFADGTVLVENNLQHGENLLPKSGRSRRVRIASEIMELLQQMKDEAAGEGESTETCADSPGYVFVNGKTGKPYDEDTIRRHLRQIGEQIGCPWLHCHSLRHSFATISLAGGASLSGVSKRLGHANVSVTSKYYVHPDNREADEAGELMRSYLSQEQCHME